MCMHAQRAQRNRRIVVQVNSIANLQPPAAAMKKRKQSILARAAQQAPRPKKQKTQSEQAAPRNRKAGRAQAPQQQQGGATGGGGGGKHPRDTQQHQSKQPAGLRPVSVVHQQAAYAVRRLLEADASKRGGVTLKSLTLGPQVAAKKVGSAAFLNGVVIIC